MLVCIIVVKLILANLIVVKMYSIIIYRKMIGPGG